jgi:hypothetical protein
VLRRADLRQRALRLNHPSPRKPAAASGIRDTKDGDSAAPAHPSGTFAFLGFDLGFHREPYVAALALRSAVSQIGP